MRAGGRDGGAVNGGGSGARGDRGQLSGQLVSLGASLIKGEEEEQGSLGKLWGKVFKATEQSRTEQYQLPAAVSLKSLRRRVFK